MQYVLSISYGKDSLACLGAIEHLRWPLDRIVTADVWATDDIPAEYPPVVEFKAYVDDYIKRRYGIEVEHYSPVTFKAPSGKKGSVGHTVHDFDRRFQLEDEGFLTPGDPRFKWAMLDQELNYRLF